MAALRLGSLPPPSLTGITVTKKCERFNGGFKVVGDGGGDNGFPPFLPKEIEKIKDPFARNLARRIKRLPVQIGCSESYIMSSCVQPLAQTDANPVALLHCFDSSCLEWRRAYPLLEESGLEAWALDILGWGFSDLGSSSHRLTISTGFVFMSIFLRCALMTICVYIFPPLPGRLPPCNVASKRYHFYQLWKSYIKRPMILVGPSLGAAVAIDFAVHYPEAVEKLVLINPSVYAEGTGNLAKLPKVVAYAGVSLLKTFPLRLYANLLAFDGIPLSKSLDWTNVGRLHCHMPWWKDATVNFMVSGGYNVVSKIKQVKQKTLIICGENDKIVSNQLAMADTNTLGEMKSLQSYLLNTNYFMIVLDDLVVFPINLVIYFLTCLKRLRFELPNASMQRLPDCGHLCHVDKPRNVVKLIADFARAK
ncbi:hypothetical protein Godav_014775 [Gossypium davidsonii]|uniref:Serine aminopeptidase S33 domain-containing protein n=2 Tax=Gossypium TaxID=3633 RepID=A0A7J8RLR3_GOSDV|nr:hypothetical protein [Gossypium davidsonii]MBA0649723.1 hypothetical protein [Gossypium klotzschianum]